MYKRELFEIPVKFEPDESLRKSKEYLLVAHVADTKYGEVLVVEIFYSLNEEPSDRVFLTKDDDITVTLKYGKNGEWKKGSIYSITGGYWYTKNYNNSEETKKIIADYIGVTVKEKDTAIQIVQRHQEDIRRRKLDRKYKKVTDPIDERMKQVPKAPDDFEEWTSKVAMYDFNYMFYAPVGKEKKQGFCTRCRNTVVLDSAKSGDYLICPSCNTKIMAIAQGKTTWRREYKTAYLLQKMGLNIVWRRFEMGRRFNREDANWNVKDSCYETDRKIFDNNLNEIERYTYSLFKQRETRWNVVEGYSTGYASREEVAVYNNNIYEVLKNTRIENAGIKQLAETEKGFTFCFSEIFYNFEDFKFIEYLNKNKLGYISKDYLNGKGRSNRCSRYATSVKETPINEDATTLEKLLKVEKYDVKYLQENKANMTGLEYLHNRRKTGQKPIPEHMEYIQTIFENKFEDFLRLMEYSKPGKIIKYLKHNNRTLVSSRMAYTKLYEDYLGLARQIGYDLRNDFVLFPKQLKLRHDQCIDILNERKEELNNKSMKKLYKKYMKEYYMEYKGLCIIPPKTTLEIAKEGQEMHHCVGTYAERAVKGQTVILFIRKLNDIEQSFYTVEVRGGEVIQCRGKYNADPTREVSQFMNRFKKKISKEEERKVS